MTQHPDDSHSPPHAAPEPTAKAADTGRPAAGLAGAPLTEKEQKNLFFNAIVGIVLLELAVTVGAVVYTITNAAKTAAGDLRFTFPWVGYLVTVTLVPVLVMLILHLVSLGFSRTLGRDSGDGRDSLGGDPNAVLGKRAASFYALVRGAPTVILFAGFVLMGAAVYYLDGVMALLLKLGDSFQIVAVWLVGALGVAFCVNAVARAVLAYKTRQLEAEYAFRREVFERTGTILMSSKQVALSPGMSMPQTVQAALTVEAGLPVHTVAAELVEIDAASSHRSGQTTKSGTSDKPRKADKPGTSGKSGKSGKPDAPKGAGKDTTNNAGAGADAGSIEQYRLHPDPSGHETG